MSMRSAVLDHVISPLTARIPGRSIYSAEWDLCIVLDACRADLFRQVAPEYPWLPDGEIVRSPASDSKRWMRATFDRAADEDLARTTYVCANPLLIQSDVDVTRFHRVDQPWKTMWDTDRGTIPADRVTWRTYSAWTRRTAGGCVLAHYMQPHYPFVGCSLVDSPPMTAGPIKAEGADRKQVWDLLRNGEVRADLVWEAYANNLRYALDSVEQLLAAIDEARVLLTSDHGNGLGEWGIYGHPPWAPTPEVRLVPWVEFTADAVESSGEEPTGVDGQEIGDGTEMSAANKLAALGYK